MNKQILKIVLLRYIQVDIWAVNMPFFFCILIVKHIERMNSFPLWGYILIGILNNLIVTIVPFLILKKQLKDK